jgi:hypothetical protein
MDKYISLAVKQGPTMLHLGQIDLGNSPAPESVGEWCNSFARRVAERYLSGGLTWDQADVAANSMFQLMTKTIFQTMRGRFTWLSMVGK